MYEKLMEAISLNVVRITYEKNISLRKLSKDIGKNDGNIARMLCGKFAPSLKTLCLIAEELDITVSDLISL